MECFEALEKEMRTSSYLFRSVRHDDTKNSKNQVLAVFRNDTQDPV